jgi:hypothetical protein
MFLTSLTHRLKNSYFADGGNLSKAGMTSSAIVHCTEVKEQLLTKPVENN